MGTRRPIRWSRWISVARWTGVAFALLAVAAIVLLLVFGTSEQ